MAAVVFPRVPRPDVSVLMVTYGRWEFVSRALRSLLENTGPCYEVIVVDNASPDDTAARLRDEVVNARLVFNTTNRGFGPATNQAASLATAPYLALLNSDCFVQAGWLPPLVQAMDEDETLGAVAPLILNVDGSLQESGCLLFGNAYTQLFGSGDDAEKPAYRFRRTVDYASGACLVLRRRTFLDLGGFDAAFVPAYFEDVDFCLRLREHGRRTLVEPRSVVTHVRGASGGSPLALEHWSRNLPVFRARWKDVLARRPAFTEPAATPRSTLSARDAAAEGAILLVSERFPGSAAGCDAEAFRVLETLAAGWPGCRITALATAAPPDNAVVDELSRRGVEVAAGVEDAAAWLEQRRLHYDAVLFGDDRSASLFSAALHAFQPQASRIEIAGSLDYEALVAALARTGVAPPRGGASPLRAAAAPAASKAAGPGVAPYTRPVALLVLGMHRSGTSALMGCLDQVRVPLGAPLLPPNFANEKGYFEHADVVEIHDDLLRGLGSSALDPIPLAARWVEEPVARAAKERLRDVVRRNFEGVSLWALKDPRICILLPLWLSLLEEEGIDARFVLMLRNPWEIARSLKHRDGLDTRESLDLWFRHTTASEVLTRGRLRAFVTYDGLLSDPEATLAGLAGALSIGWPLTLADARDGIRGFLEPSLRHWGKAVTHDDAPPELDGPTGDLYEALLELQDRDERASRRRVDFLRAVCDSALGPSRLGRPGPGSEEEYDVRWLSLEAPPVMKAGERTTGRASFSHAGRLPLSSRALCVSYHWLDADDRERVVVWDGPRTPVRRILAPGETWAGGFTVQAPELPGRYLLRVDLVREGVAWFSPKGAVTMEAAVLVER